MASRIDKFTMFMDGLFYFEVGVRFIAAKKKKEEEEEEEEEHTHAQRRYSDAFPSCAVLSHRRGSGSVSVAVAVDLALVAFPPVPVSALLRGLQAVTDCGDTHL